MRILAIDDDDDLRMLVRLTLSAAGHEISEAASGAEALAVATPGAFDLLLVDGTLPDGSGPKIVAQLLVRIGKTPVVYLSGDAEACLREDPSALGAIEKPLDVATLPERLNAFFA